MAGEPSWFELGVGDGCTEGFFRRAADIGVGEEFHAVAEL